jgi:Reversibly glycosylated polypeptide
VDARKVLVSAKFLIIMPSVRNAQAICDYADNATKYDFDKAKLEFLILTEDFVDKHDYSKSLEKAGVKGIILNETDRLSLLRELNLSRFSHVFPRRSHAETSFGLFFMYMNDYDYGIMIDDDTRPLDDTDYFGGHVENLQYRGEIESLESNKKWVNVLYQSFSRHGLYPRGYPYAMTNESNIVRKANVTNVVMSQGLWTNIPDLDALRILIEGDLNGQSRTRLTRDDFTRNFTVAKNNYLTICSMNLAFKRDVIPCFYQFKMDDNPWGVGRFDDIWSGIVAKKVIDSMEWNITNGNPLCEHNKAPRNTFKDLRSEVLGLEANEHFHTVVDSADTSCGDIFAKSNSIAKCLVASADEFISYSGKHFIDWLSLLTAIS